jgi:uncharacterized protein YbbC (DUF1343 family)
MARYANVHRRHGGRVEVVPMAGWTRATTWADTGRSWVNPSPNLRSAEAALAYPGTCLLEATNLSEGRGTKTPFLVFGAPWLDAEALASSLSVPGLALDLIRFTPEPSPAAPRPKHAGVECAGLRVRVTDARTVRTYAFGLELVSALRRQPDFEWARGGKRFDTLLGTTSVRKALEGGQAVADILAADAPGIERFSRERQDVLLY